MGRLAFAFGSALYIDTAPIIYSVEKHPVYWDILEDLWAAARIDECRVVTSELSLLETLVQPLRAENHALATCLRRVPVG